MFVFPGSNEGPDVRVGEPPDQLSRRQQPANHLSRISPTLEDTRTSSEKIKQNKIGNCIFTKRKNFYFRTLYIPKSEASDLVLTEPKEESNLKFDSNGLE